MSLPEPGELVVGDIAREFLHVFVYGPGYGEGVAVALPGSGWLVVDSCAAAGKRPLIDLLEQYPDDPIDAVVLTHPHEDHTDGLLELLIHDRLGPRIRKVGCVARNIVGDPDNTLGAELEARATTVNPLDPAALDAFGRSRQVLERIRKEWDDDPGRRLPLSDGASIPLSSSGVSATVLAPSSSDVQDFFAASDLPARIRSQANELSIVVRISFGTTTLLLGGDLPRERSSGATVPSGWIAVAARHASLERHSGLKVPHHASKYAIGPELLGDGPAGRAWFVTPWNKGRGLPNFAPQHGPARLLGVEPELMLTALPVSVVRQPVQPARQSLATLQTASAQLKASSALLQGAITVTDKIDAAACCWVAAFDDAGRMVERQRGDRATIVTP